ncbi:MAG: FMN-binding protein [Deltaproteobacteria bacterium]|nr:FMN-binding protein [Deltaproteobacteria bacterium]
MVVAACATGRTARAAVFLAKDEALALAFPGADRVEERVVILTDAQKAEIEKRARAPLESQLWTIHVGWKDGVVQGYAVIDSHIVRTLPETFMVVVDPDGKLRRVDVLAFHEPPEYLPTQRWIGQFAGHALDEDLKLGAGIQGITGATLSAQAMTAGVRRALALVAVAVLAPGAARAAEPPRAAPEAGATPAGVPSGAR